MAEAYELLAAQGAIDKPGVLEPFNSSPEGDELPAVEAVSCCVRI